MTVPLSDERVVRREFKEKCYFDADGTVLQLLKQRALILARMKIYRQAEEQKEFYDRNGVLHLQPGEVDVRDKLDHKKGYIKKWRTKLKCITQACNPEWTNLQRYLSFAVCPHTRKTICMAPTCFPRCAASLLAHHTKDF